MMPAVTLRKWEWPTFLIGLIGIGALAVAIALIQRAAAGAGASWLLWVVVGVCILLGLVAVIGAVAATPLQLRIDDAGITQRRGWLVRHVPWSRAENLWVAKRGSAVSVVSSTAVPTSVHPFDVLQARRLNVRPDHVIGSIRPDQLAQLESGVRVHGQRELPVVYAH